MSPLLHDGDYVLYCRWPHAWLKPHQWVVLTHPHYGEIVKRVHHRNTDGSLALCGENADSISMQAMGDIHNTQAIYKVIKAIKA